jgi:NADH-quinone oxidoreductase subunit A
MQFHFASVLVMFVLSVGFLFAMLALGSLLRPKNPEASKETTYECGELPTGSAWLNFNIRFYVIALIFLVFEVEIVFMLPVAAVFREWVLDGRGLFALAEILVFVAILLVGLAHVWAKGDFDWIKRVSDAPPEGDRPGDGTAPVQR